MKQKAYCSICNSQIEERGRHAKHRNWIGYVRYSNCSYCKRAMILFYTEGKAFAGSQAGKFVDLDTMWRRGL